MTTVKSMGSSKACWEINGCGYRPGSGVDTSFGCKSLPAKGVTDPCCSNMAWIVDEKAKTITSAWNTSLCFQLKSSSSGGGELEACDGSPEQQWTLRKQQNASGALECEMPSLTVASSVLHSCILTHIQQQRHWCRRQIQMGLSRTRSSPSALASVSRTSAHCRATLQILIL